jgi:hypothetical protein
VSFTESNESKPEPVILTGASGAQYELGESIGSFGDTPASECDAEDGGRYYGPGGTIVCRCIVCSRCGHHTGNSNQGHYWAYCKVTKSKREFHFCCPGDCGLEAVSS